MPAVFRQILTQAESAPEKVALIFGDEARSYAELSAGVARCAAALAQQYHVSPGDRVLLVAGSSPGFVCAYLAVHSIGAIAVPVDPNAAGDRLADIAYRVTPSVALSETGLPGGPFEQASFDELDAFNGSMRPVDATLESPADILFTTGTTGQAKGVVLSHNALVAASAHINAFVGTNQGDIEVLPLPLSHSFGLGRLRCVLSSGASLVLVPGFMHTAGIVKALSEHRATGFASVPTGIAILLRQEGTALSSFAPQLRYVEIGSSSMPMEHKKLLMKLLPHTRLCMHYGLTEASRSAFLSFHDDENKLGSIGRPSPGVSMRIVAETGDELPVDAEGEIEISGPHLMSGYWRDPDLTRRSLNEQWLRTGDLARRDGDGFFWLGARASDIINVGGRKVAPQEIEQVLLQHPAIADCACRGLPDPQGLTGQIIGVWMVAEPGVETLPRFPELARRLRQKLEPYKIPRQFHWVDQIPKSSSGKVLRQQLGNEL